MAAARYNLDFIAKMGFDYVAYQHLDPEAPFYYNNAGNYRHAPVTCVTAPSLTAASM